MKKCLIVDDSRDDRQIAFVFLKGLGFEVLEATNSDAALSMCRLAMPDCILIDHKPPQLDGLDFLTRLQRIRGGDHPTVFFCSGSADAETMGAAIWRGAAECLIKPFDADLLRFKLKQAGLIAGHVPVAA